MSCDQTIQVQAYHDGEMSSAARAAFEAHLRACGVCALELESLRRLSARLASAPIPKISADAMKRLHANVGAVEERGVLRLAEWMTAAAAAVLLIGVLGFFRSDTTHASAPDTWEQAAVAFPAEAEPSERAELVQVAEWIRMDLSAGAK
jgi:anti-sigma factor RsiW